MKNTIIVCESGWILVGKAERPTSETVMLTDASVVRCWRSGKGIGGLVKESNKPEYTLDEVGGVSIRTSKILFEIPCEW